MKPVAVAARSVNGVSAFTLVELLVVVAIIVVLLALLAPAMDRAIYQAEMAVCGANLHGIATGVLLYASENRRAYPHRRLVDAGHDHMKITGIVAYTPGGWFDDRLLIRNHIKINGLMQCPLNSEVDMEIDGAQSNVFTSYFMGFNWGYIQGSQTERRMNRVGDAFSFETQEFRVLAGDWYTIETGQGSGALGSHPDHTRLMSTFRHQSEPNPWGADSILGGPLNGTVTLSWWQSIGNYTEPRVDLQFIGDDVAVVRYDGFGWDDKRLARVPHYANVQIGPTSRSYLPAR